jgi:hypothetical protein
LTERVTLAGPLLVGCATGNHAWEILPGGEARCRDCLDSSTFSKTDLAAAQLLKAQRGAGVGDTLLQAVLDRNATSVRTVEED